MSQLTEVVSFIVFEIPIVRTKKKTMFYRYIIYYCFLFHGEFEKKLNNNKYNEIANPTLSNPNPPVIRTNQQY